MLHICAETADSCESYTNSAWTNASKPAEFVITGTDCPTSSCTSLVAARVSHLNTFYGHVQDPQKSRVALSVLPVRTHPSPQKTFHYFEPTKPWKKQTALSYGYSKTSLLLHFRQTISGNHLYFSENHSKVLLNFDVSIVLRVAAFIRTAFQTLN